MNTEALWRLAQVKDAAEVAEICLRPGGAVHIVQRQPDGTFEGVLHGADSETNAAWQMPYWLPRAAVLDLAVEQLETLP